ncbi:pilin [Patescibacteria group bacterium]
MLIVAVILTALIYLFTPRLAFALDQYPEIQSFTSDLFSSLSILASVFVVFFLVRGGYLYITSSGKPEALENAKKTIRNALIGLVLVLSASTFSSILTTSFTTPSPGIDTTQIQLAPLETVEPEGGLTQVLTEAIAGFLKNIIQSATKPLTDSVISFLTTTPLVATNQSIFNFWLVILGITDSLFVLVIALLGFQLMSASTFGFEEVELKKLLPRIGLSFLLANVSIFLVDWVLRLNNALISTVINATGGLNQAWIENAFNPSALSIENVAVITLVFGVLFIILTVVLLLFYISRLIVIALGAVLSPLIFMLWAIPRFADFSEIAVKSYLTTIFSVFIHVVVIQLAVSFLTLPGESEGSGIMAVLIGIGLMFTLIKAQSIVYQFVFYNTGRAVFKKFGGQVINVLQAKQTEETVTGQADAKTPRKVINA